ncbi:proline synthetase associated protein [Theileria orientalis]|uniref:Pyridoxal phosphate homeostasis protein n=1 Tax=Theileria orientalis TaxID=68886 RepID=A0A976XJY6_THEOR|nr:proline synthetase associated protein [Theileria orientalis]
MCELVTKWKSIVSYIRPFSGVSLLVVSKNVPVESIDLLYRNGQVHFGENRVQDLFEKAHSLSPDIKWHFIGHLQTNKCSLLLRVPNLHMLESLDSMDLALKLSDLISRDPARSLFVLIQVNTSLKPTQFGIDYRQFDIILALVKAVLNSQGLVFTGLMTIGDDTGECFDRLVSIRDKLAESSPECKLLCDQDKFVLSMGMSSDYQLAISKGSTQIRIGSLIFK